MLPILNKVVDFGKKLASKAGSLFDEQKLKPKVSVGVAPTSAPTPQKTSVVQPTTSSSSSKFTMSPADTLRKMQSDPILNMSKVLSSSMETGKPMGSSLSFSQTNKPSLPASPKTSTFNFNDTFLGKTLYNTGITNPESILRKSTTDAGKFVAKTALFMGSATTDILDFVADATAKRLPDLIVKKALGPLGGKLGSVLTPDKYEKPLTETYSRLKNEWLNFYEQGKQSGIVPYEKANQTIQKLQQSESLQPSEEYKQSSFKDNLMNRPDEVIFEIGPSIVGSIGMFALAGPTAGAAILGGATANDIKDEAIAYGVDEDRAELLGASGGILIASLDRIVPSRVFGNSTVKTKFVQSLSRRLATQILTEPATEIAQEGIQLAIEKTFRDDLGWDEVKTRTAMSGFGGLLGGGMMSGIEVYTNEVMRQQVAEGMKSSMYSQPPEGYESINGQQPAFGLSMQAVKPKEEVPVDRREFTRVQITADRPLAAENLIKPEHIKDQRTRTNLEILLRGETDPEKIRAAQMQAHDKYVDDLTGLLNNNATEAFDLGEVPQLSIDVNDLKVGNGAIGEDNMNLVFEKFGQLMQEKLPDRGIRQGGDEFAAITPGLEGTKTLNTLNEIRDEMKKFVQNTPAITDWTSRDGSISIKKGQPLASVMGQTLSLNGVTYTVGDLFDFTVGHGTSTLEAKAARDKQKGVQKGVDKLDIIAYNRINEDFLTEETTRATQGRRGARQNVQRTGAGTGQELEQLPAQKGQGLVSKTGSPAIEAVRANLEKLKRFQNVGKQPPVEGGLNVKEKYTRLISDRELQLLKDTGEVSPALTGFTRLINPGKINDIKGVPKTKKHLVIFKDNIQDLIEGDLTAGGSGETQTQIRGKVPKDYIENVVENYSEISELEPITESAEQTEEINRSVQEVAETKERKFITSVKEEFPELISKINGQYDVKHNNALVERANKRIKDNIDEAYAFALTAKNDEAIATADLLIQYYAELAEKTSDPNIKSLLEDKAAEIANTVAPVLTQYGRNVQAASLVGRLTPAGMLRFAARQINKYNEKNPNKPIPKLTGQEAGDIISRIKEVQAMPDGNEKIAAWTKLQNDLMDRIPSPLFKKIISIWKAGLLTGIKTSGLNIMSTSFNVGMENLIEIPASGIDSIISLFSGKRTLAWTLRGYAGGGQEGLVKGWNYMRTGFDERKTSLKIDRMKVNMGTSPVAKALQAYEDGIFRIIGAEDMLFYYGVKAHSIYSQAIAQSKNQKLKGAERQAFVDNLVEHPTDDMLRIAVNDAEVATFNNRTALGDVAGAIQKLGGGVGEIVVPFSRTPSAVVMQIINYTPVGIAKTIIQNVGTGKFDQRMFSKGLARGLTGTGILYIGAELFKMGLVSLGYPDDEREQNQMDLEGRTPNSIKIFGKWRSISALGPAGNILLIGAYYQQALDETGSPTEAITQAVFGGAKSLTEQTFLKGVNSALLALNDPEKRGLSYVKRLIGSTIPTISSDIAQALDPSQRRTDEKFFDPLLSRIPGLREQLEPKEHVFGRPIERAGNVIETLADPTRPSKIKSSALIQEIGRLNEVGHPATPTDFGTDSKFDVLTPQQKTRLMERAGQLLEYKLTLLIQLSSYKKLDDESKAKKIQDFTEIARRTARAEMVAELVQDMDEEEKKKKLAELKKSGFMTKTVYERYKELF